VFTLWYVLSPYIKQTSLNYKGLKLKALIDQVLWSLLWWRLYRCRVDHHGTL